MPEPSLRAYVDESSVLRDGAQEYRVCAVVIERPNEESLRAELRRFLLPGQLKFHWTKEGPTRRSDFVDFISKCDNVHYVVTHTDAPRTNDERYRRKCLETLYFELTNMGIEQAIFESRSAAQDNLDIAHIVAVQSMGLFKTIRLSHIAGKDEPLLWIADAALGAVNSFLDGSQEFLNKFASNSFLRIATHESR